MKLISAHVITTMDGEDPVEAALVTGAVNGTIVRSLELVNNTEADAVVTVVRKDDSITPAAYGTVQVPLPAGDYIALWVDCQVALPLAYTLNVYASVAGIQIVANAAER